MQDIRPQQLTDQELVHYAHLMGYDKLPTAWVQEIVTRFERSLDDGK